MRALGLDRASDEDIWNYAKVHGFVIVTQDADFAEQSRLLGSPPKVVWLHCGNTKPSNIEAVLRSGAQALAELAATDGLNCIELL